MRLSQSAPARGAEPEPDLLHDAVWLYSYADLVTQLLLFIILTVTVVGIVELTPEAKAAPSSEEKLDATAKELASYVSEHGLEQSVAIDRSADRLVVRLGSVLLFEEASDALTANAAAILTPFAGVVGGLPNALRVEGHTDDVPIHTTRFASNWELSSARAIAVVRFLENSGVRSSRLSAAGYGEFHPIIANDSREHRATNRRVELVMLGEANDAPLP